MHPPLRASSTRRLLLAAAFVVCLRAPAYAQISEASWRAFIEASDSEFRKPDERIGFEDYLYEAATSHRQRTKAIAAFSARIGVPRDAGAAYAAVIVESVRREDGGCRAPCAFLPGDAFYDRVARLGAEPTGGLLIAVGKNLDRRSLVQDRGWVALALRHPKAAPVLRALFAYTEEMPLLAAMFAGTDPNAWSASSIAAAVGHWDSGPDDWSGWFDAFLEAAEDRARDAHAPLDVRAAIAEISLGRELRLGLTADAIRRYLAYPEDVRRSFPVAIDRSTNPCRSDDSYAFLDSLAAALWQTGHHADARALLRDEHAGLGVRSLSSRARFAVLSDIFVPTVPAADLFDRYLVPDHADRATRCAWPGSGAWLDAALESPQMRPLAAARLRQAGYADMAASLEAPGLFGRTDGTSGVLADYARLFPPSVRTRRDQWSAMIDEAWQASSQSMNSGRPTHVKARADVPAWPERPLSRGMAAWKDRNRAPRPPAGLPLPIDPETILRYEAVGGEHAIVYQSSDYDMPGEVPAFGVWFMRTERGQWTRPVYLGLRQYFPYVVTPGSALPLLAGDVLQLEVRIREMDPASITFPPIATSLLRSADGLYLVIDLAKARMDRDNDGLSDIEEIALGLDPANADTDGDGLPDGSDGLPLTAYRQDAAAADMAMARAVLNRILGHDAEAIVTGPTPATTHTRAGARFLIADPAIFAGISSAPFRLIVYSEDDLRVLARGHAPFYPPKITRMFSSLDGRRRYVDWSAQWAGGRFVVTCPPAGECTTADLLSWVS